MDNFLLDRETLGKFVDELMAKKPLNVKSPEELDELREAKMKELDGRVSEAVFGTLNQEQLAELNTMMDDVEMPAERFTEFFAKNNVDIEKIMEETFLAYAKEFLGGKDE